MNTRAPPIRGANTTFHDPNVDTSVFLETYDPHHSSTRGALRGEDPAVGVARVQSRKPLPSWLLLPPRRGGIGPRSKIPSFRRRVSHVLPVEGLFLRSGCLWRKERVGLKTTRIRVSKREAPSQTYGGRKTELASQIIDFIDFSCLLSFGGQRSHWHFCPGSEVPFLFSINDVGKVWHSSVTVKRILVGANKHR